LLVFSAEYFHERVQAEIEAGGKHTPSVASLKRYAAAVGVRSRSSLSLLCPSGEEVPNQASERPYRITPRQTAQLEHYASEITGLNK